MWTTVLPLCIISSAKNNHLTSAQFPDKNTNLLWVLGILLPHIGACHSRACRKSGFLVLLQENRSGHMSECWKTSQHSLHSLSNPYNLPEAAEEAEGARSKGRIWTREWKVQGGGCQGPTQKGFPSDSGPAPEQMAEAEVAGPTAEFLLSGSGDLKDCF